MTYILILKSNTPFAIWTVCNRGYVTSVKPLDYANAKTVYFERRYQAKFDPFELRHYTYVEAPSREALIDLYPEYFI